MGQKREKIGIEVVFFFIVIAILLILITITAFKNVEADKAIKSADEIIRVYSER